MKRILIDSSVHQTRVALMEDGELIELIYDNKDAESIVGNIYCGRVENVLRGMNAAFVEIGEAKKAYLYFEEEEVRPKAGDEILVQAEKDAFGSKGPVVTRKVSFPGKFIVLIPGDARQPGVSKKITDIKKRDRIRDIIAKLVPAGYSVIVRTEGADKTEEEYEKEISALVQRAERVDRESRFVKAPAVLYKDDSSVLKAARELYTKDVESIVLNSREDWEMLLRAADLYGIEKEKISFYEDNIPLFQNYFVESQAEKAFHRKIWLKSGGFLMIEQTEACVVIDVNTGKYTGKKELRETFLKTNLEAAEEIARQLRLRNLSGIIIIDFIDMKQEEDKRELAGFLEAAVKKDRIKTTVVGMTELGLMQLTRKKTRPSLLYQMTGECKCCQGSGRVPNLSFVVGNIRRQVENIFVQTIFSCAVVRADKRFLSAFAGKNGEYQRDLEKKYGKIIELEEIQTVTYGYFEVEGKMARGEKKTEVR